MNSEMEVQGSQMKLTRRSVLSAVVACMMAPVRFAAGDDSVRSHFRLCAGCGNKRSCCQVCRLVEEEKSVKVTCWGMECEEIVLPSPSTRGCEHCETVCVDCQKKGGEWKEGEAKEEKVIAKPKAFVWTKWIPGKAGYTTTHRKLMKKTETKKVPSFKWVVEDLCDECRREAEKKNSEASSASK